MPQSAGLTAIDIRIALIRKGKPMSQIAHDIGANYSHACCVMRGEEETPYIRRGIAAALDLSYEEVWGVPDPGIDRKPTHPARPEAGS